MCVCSPAPPSLLSNTNDTPTAHLCRAIAEHCLRVVPKMRNAESEEIAGEVAMESLEFSATRKNSHSPSRTSTLPMGCVLLEEFHAASVIYVARSKSTCQCQPYIVFCRARRNDELGYGRPMLACSRLFAVKSAGAFFSSFVTLFSGK